MEDVQFEFPDAQDREDLKKVRCYDDLRIFLLDLKRSQKYSNHVITYTIRVWSKQELGMRFNHISVYFTCCKYNYHRPAIHFVSVNKGSFKLKSRSNYQHCHLEKRKKSHQKDKPQKEFVRAKEIKKVSNENKKQQPKRISNKIFKFPTKNQLLNSQTAISIGSFMSRLSNFYRVDEYKDKKIRCQGLSYEEQDEQGIIVEHFIVGFKCCYGANENLPYFHFIKKEKDLYHLQSYNDEHDHQNSAAINLPQRDKTFIKMIRQQIMSNYKNDLQQNQQNQQKINTEGQNFIEDKINKQNLLYHQIPENPNFESQNIDFNHVRMQQERPIRSNKELIFYQLQNYNKKSSAYIFDAQRNSSFHKNLQNKQQKNFPIKSQVITNQTQDQQIWNECIFEMLDLNGFQILEMFDLQNYSIEKNHYWFDNLLYVRKIQNQQENANQEKQDYSKHIDIFLAAFPLKIETIPNALQILIAYTLTPEYHPKLLWFHISQKKSDCLSVDQMLSQNEQTQTLSKVLRQAIKYFQLKKVTFIITTLDLQLITALDKVCQSTSKSSQRFASTLHIQCLKTYVNTLDSDRNFLLENEMKTRIYDSSKFENIKTSYKILKNILKIRYDEDQLVINPRLIFNHYRTFSEPFTNQKNSQNSQNYAKAFLFSNLSEKNESNEIENPITQINELFTENNRFSKIAEIYVLVIRVFNINLRKLSEIARKALIIPSEFYEAQKWCQYFKRICPQELILKYPIQRIFNEPAYQLFSVVKRCPKFITQNISRLIVIANELASKNQYQSVHNDESLDFKSYIHNQVLHTKKSYKVLMMSRIHKESKKWLCCCNFYIQTGIPCEHEIMAALQNKDSIFNEIHSNWKLPNDFQGS